MKPGRLKKPTKHLFLLKNYDIFTTPLGFTHIATRSRPGIDPDAESKTETEMRLWGYESEALKNVSRDMYRYIS